MKIGQYVAPSVAFLLPLGCYIDSYFAVSQSSGGGGFPELDLELFCYFPFVDAPQDV